MGGHTDGRTHFVTNELKEIRRSGERERRERERKKKAVKTAMETGERFLKIKRVIFIIFTIKQERTLENLYDLVF